jgi:hypothetical protein
VALSVVLSLVCAAGCLGFIAAEHAQSNLARAATKVIASAAFVL